MTQPPRVMRVSHRVFPLSRPRSFLKKFWPAWKLPHARCYRVTILLVEQNGISYLWALVSRLESTSLHWKVLADFEVRIFMDTEDAGGTGLTMGELRFGGVLAFSTRLVWTSQIFKLRGDGISLRDICCIQYIICSWLQLFLHEALRWWDLYSQNMNVQVDIFPVIWYFVSLMPNDPQGQILLSSYKASPTDSKNIQDAQGITDTGPWASGVVISSF